MPTSSSIKQGQGSPPKLGGFVAQEHPQASLVGDGIEDRRLSAENGMCHREVGGKEGRDRLYPSPARRMVRPHCRSGSGPLCVSAVRVQGESLLLLRYLVRTIQQGVSLILGIDRENPPVVAFSKRSYSTRFVTFS